MRHLWSIVLSGAMLVLADAASGKTHNSGYATVVRIQGKARYSLGDTNWHLLVVGNVLRVGTIVQTSHDGILDMVLGKTVEQPQAAPVPNRIALAPDANVRGMISFRPAVEQNMIRMMGDTVVRIDQLNVSDTGLDTVSYTELDLKYGRIYASVKKLSAASFYFIKIPRGVAGVRGTFFELDASGRCAVLKNSVSLALRDASGTAITYLITEGNQFDPETGQISPLPTDLLGTLQEVSTALDTTYEEVMSLSVDGTTTFISPTTGRH